MSEKTPSEMGGAELADRLEFLFGTGDSPTIRESIARHRALDSAGIAFGIHPDGTLRVIDTLALRAAQPAAAGGWTPTQPDVDAVEEAVGMGRGAWDMVDPIELLRAVAERAGVGVAAGGWTPVGEGLPEGPRYELVEIAELLSDGTFSLRHATIEALRTWKAATYWRYTRGLPEVHNSDGEPKTRLVRPDGKPRCGVMTEDVTTCYLEAGHDGDHMTISGPFSALPAPPAGAAGEGGGRDGE